MPISVESLRETSSPMTSITESTTCTLRFVHIRFYCSKYPTGHVLLVQEEADVKFRIRQFFTKITCHKAVFQIVVLHRRVLLYAAEAAVMIGKHQPVPGHHHSGTKASKLTTASFSDGRFVLYSLLTDICKPNSFMVWRVCLFRFPSIHIPSSACPAEKKEADSYQYKSYFHSVNSCIIQ